jgi:hypothetical protein
MTTRTTTSTVTFRKPFRLSAFLEPLPAGTYSIETDEELLEGVSFPAYQRMAIVMHLNADASPSGIRESVILDPAQFEETLAADGVQEIKTGIDTPMVRS